MHQHVGSVKEIVQDVHCDGDDEPTGLEPAATETNRKEHGRYELSSKPHEGSLEPMQRRAPKKSFYGLKAALAKQTMVGTMHVLGVIMLLALLSYVSYVVIHGINGPRPSDLPAPSSTSVSLTPSEPSALADWVATSLNDAVPPTNGTDDDAVPPTNGTDTHPTGPTAFPDCLLSTLCLDHVDSDVGGVLFEIVLFGYCFLALAIVCDEYLVVALETLCIRWSIREDVAGATFMAFGSAAPEIIINTITTIKSGGAANDAARGTALSISAIIGSGMIAFSAIPAICGLAASSALDLKRRPLVRDVSFYSLGLAMLVLFFNDGQIQLWEGAALVSCYVVYVVVVAVSPSIWQWYCEWNDPSLKLVKRTSFVEQSKSQSRMDPTPLLSQDSPGSTHTSISPSQGQPLHTPATKQSCDEACVVVDVEAAATKDGDAHVDETRNQWSQQLAQACALPLKLVFKWTMPVVEYDTAHEWLYPVTLTISLVYVAVLSFVIGTIAQRWSDLLQLPAAAFGLYLISIGAEVPDAIQSVTVAKRGYGSMAVSNCVGSQICNIFVGLGLPWLLFNLINHRPVQVDTMPKGTQHVTLRTAALFQFGVVGVFTCLMLGHAVISRLDKASLTKTKAKGLMGVYIIVLAGFGITIALDHIGV